MIICRFCAHHQQGDFLAAVNSRVRRRRGRLRPPEYSAPIYEEGYASVRVAISLPRQVDR